MTLKAQHKKPPKKPHGGGWQDKLQAIVAPHIHLKVGEKGNVANESEETRITRIFHIFKLLRKELHFGIEDPKNLRPHHVEKLVEYWVREELAPITITNYLSVLRIFSCWIGKTGMVKSLGQYAPGLQINYVATRDKSWSGNVEDPWVLWDRVYQKDINVGLQMLLVMAFGVRRKEAVSFKPHIHAQENFIELYQGTKGGRPRVLPIATGFQREVIQILKDHIRSRKGRPEQYIGNPNKTLIQNLRRYDNTLVACGITKKNEGVTGHGLRVEFTIDELEKRGVVSSVRTETGQVTTKLSERLAAIKAADKGAMQDLVVQKIHHASDAFEKELACLHVSESLGHSRKSVITAYTGPLRLTKAQKDAMARSQPEESVKKEPVKVAPDTYRYS